MIKERKRGRNEGKNRRGSETTVERRNGKRKEGKREEKDRVGRQRNTGQVRK